MFRRLDKFDGLYAGEGELIFGMLIRLHIWGGRITGGKLIYGCVLMGFYGILELVPSCANFMAEMQTVDIYCVKCDTFPS